MSNQEQHRRRFLWVGGLVVGGMVIVSVYLLLGNPGSRQPVKVPHYTVDRRQVEGPHRELVFLITKTHRRDKIAAVVKDASKKEFTTAWVFRPRSGMRSIKLVAYAEYATTPRAVGWMTTGEHGPPPQMHLTMR